MMVTHFNPPDGYREPFPECDHDDELDRIMVAVGRFEEAVGTYKAQLFVSCLHQFTDETGIPVKHAAELIVCLLAAGLSLGKIAVVKKPGR
jgi:hypothetical protein